MHYCNIPRLVKSNKLWFFEGHLRWFVIVIVSPRKIIREGHTWACYIFLEALQ